MNEMKIPIDRSLTNSIAERTNQFILTATATCLLEAGLPPCFRRTAIHCVCHLLNVEPNDDELSAWCSFDEPEQHPHDDEVKDYVKQAWEKIKIDLMFDDDEAQEQDDEDVEMGDQTEEVGDEEEEEESEMDDLNAEKRDFREKDEADEYPNKER